MEIRDEGQCIKQINLFENRFIFFQSLQKRTQPSDHIDFHLVINSTDAAAGRRWTPDQQNCTLREVLVYLAFSVVTCHTA